MRREYLALGAALCLAWPAVAAEEEVVRHRQQEAELRSSWIVGSAVQGTADERVGTVSTLILDRATGRVTAVVLSTGGLLGFGGKNVGVRWDQLGVGRDGLDLSVDLSAPDVDNAPVFDYRQQARRLPESPSTEPGSASDLPGSR